MVITVALNQKLAFSQYLLKLAADLPGEDVAQRNQQHALLDSAVLQLRAATELCVREFAEQAGQPVVIEEEFPSLLALVHRAQQNLPSVELQQWAEWLIDPSSWLSQLCQAARDPLVLAQAYGQTTADIANLIATGSLSPLDKVTNWYRSLQQQVELWRTMVVES